MTEAPAPPDDAGEGGPDKKRLDRELIELLNELRVVLPGIQVLFAFLFTVPFTNRFVQLTSTERAVFFVSFVATAVASVLLIAPTAQHRVRWRAGDKEQLLQRSNQLAIAGTAFLTVAIAAAAYLVTAFVYNSGAAAVVAAVLAAGTVFFWYVEPLMRKLRDRD